MGAAIVAVFAMTLVLLFLRSRDFIVASLPKPPAPSVADVAATVQAAGYAYWNFHSSEVSRMIRDLADERNALRQKEADLAAEEARVKSERSENERLREDITRSRNELSEYIIQVKAGETQRLREEVGILNTMTPEAIVALLNEKSDRDVVKLLAQMKPDAVGQILESMMALPAEPNKPTPQKRAATLLEMLRRYRPDPKP